MIHVYFLKKEDEVVYVGITKSFETRKKYHTYRKPKKIFDKMEIVGSLDNLEKAKEIEDFYIKKYNPKYNKFLNKGGPYKNISDLEDKEAKIKYLLNLSKELHAKLKAHAATKGMTMQDFIIKSVEEKINK